MSETLRAPAAAGGREAFETDWLVRFERGGGGLTGSTLVTGDRGRLALVTGVTGATGATGAPATAVADGVGVVFWGDLDNAARLGESLGLAGASEAEVLLAAYRRHGRELPRAIAGRHVFVLYDAHRDLLLAARDRVGLV
ncbi:MAG TPA: hypothetical protein VFD39_05040, partial [Trueperaceae bacterium]|nr:hypothetical protein [Trueperaceae bacterium]